MITLKMNMLTTQNTLMYEIKAEDVCGDFSSSNEIFDFSNNSTKSK